MDNIIGAVFGIVLLIVGIALFPIGLAILDWPNDNNLLAIPVFLAGVLVLSAVLPLPVFILDRLDRG